ncbi:MAG: hypothetical protein CMH04_04215 [Marinovum sp.]|nr:hypothetical protein [Marinovum sp.]|tara:strand:+ start:1914 stop:2483 length:570 start_codon:yes stop_codon:yes gene_type:complete
MATLTSPVEEQNIVNRFADYVPPAANTGIVYHTGSVPFAEFATSYFGGNSSGRAIGISGANIKNNGELIDASGIQDTLENETFNYTSIRNLRAQLNVTGGGGNTGSRPSPGVITDVTAMAYLNTSYRQTLGTRSVNLQTGQLIDDSVLEQKFSDLRNKYNTARGTTATITINVCHASCHSSCHSSRGRR